MKDTQVLNKSKRMFFSLNSLLCFTIIFESSTEKQWNINFNKLFV